jgi:hypothetical protein
MAMPKSRSSSRHTPTGGRIRSGGGATLNKAKNVREATREKPRVRAASPGVVSAWGAHRGSHVTGEGGRNEVFKQEKLYSPGFQPCEFGNSKALEGAGAGARPGGGKRTVLARGTQQQYGPSAPVAKDYSTDPPATAKSERSLSEKGRVG